MGMQPIAAPSAAHGHGNDASRRILRQLMDGNARFAAGQPRTHAYSADSFAAFSRGQSPSCAIVTCADSRVAPEVVFDQPLGSFLVARVPGNVASESVRWMLDIAVGELRVPLVLVMGHTDCRAVAQVIEGKPSARHDELQRGIHAAMSHVQQTQPGAARSAFVRAVTEANARQTVVSLFDAPEVHDAVASGRTLIVPAVLDLASGRVALLALDEAGDAPATGG